MLNDAESENILSLIFFLLKLEYNILLGLFLTCENESWDGQPFLNCHVKFYKSLQIVEFIHYRSGDYFHDL